MSLLFRNTQVPIKGIQIASVNIPVASDNNNTNANATISARNSPKLIVAQNKTPTMIIRQSNVQSPQPNSNMVSDLRIISSSIV